MRIYPLFDPGGLGERLIRHLDASRGELVFHRFPDGESYVRIMDDGGTGTVAIFAQLDRPDSKTAAVLFAAAQLREMGARRVILIAPYLPYMRHDQRFQVGEALSSAVFSQWLQAHFDGLVTVDPHLHRYHSLDELYRMPTVAVSATPAIVAWLQQEVAQPLLVGPDAESEQWVRPVARQLGAPWCCLHKVRAGDRDVTVRLAADAAVPATDAVAAAGEGSGDSRAGAATALADQVASDHEIKPCQLAAMAASRRYTPVLVDDILSTGTTLIRAAQQLTELGLAAPLAIVVHALFTDHEASAHTLSASMQRVVSCDSVEHESNRITLDAVLARGVRQLCQAVDGR